MRALSLLLVVLLGCACQQPRPPVPAVQQFRGAAMGTSYSIKTVLPDGVARDRAKAAIEQALADFDLLFSTYRDDSEISRFNRHASTEPFVVSKAFRDLVASALRLARTTDGAFDPTVGPLLRLYGFGPGAGKPDAVPSAEAIGAVREHIGWQRLELRPGGLVKAVPALELDLNAIAKGAGVDVVAAALDGLGSTAYMVEIGGEVRCRGAKPDGNVWRIGISDPEGQLAEKLVLADAAMATSGSYLQFRNLGNARVHHIVDPRTGRNAVSQVVSATVVAKTCALADGMATALMVLGPDQAMQALEGSGDPEARALLLLSVDGKIERRPLRW